MTTTCSLPDFTVEQATTFISQVFGIAAELKPLDGERDLNYLVTAATGKFVFKIANQNEEIAILECQQQALMRLSADNIFPDQIQPIESVNGKTIEEIKDHSGIIHLCRLVKFVDDRLLSSVNPQAPELLFDIGNTLGKLDQSLLDFEHPALHRPLIWKLHEAHEIVERYRSMIENSERQSLIEYFLNRFRNTVLPLNSLLRRSAIHNDANDNNVLVQGEFPWSQTVSSIIDFGDMVHSWTVAEPAIAAAYAMLGKDSPLDAAVEIVRGYHQQLALDENDIKVLFDLICMRLCLSVCICAHQKTLEPDNQYLSISEKPAWELLKKLRHIPPSFAYYSFRNTCEFEAVPNHSKIVNWLKSNQSSLHSVMDVNFRNDPLLPINLGVTSPYFSRPQDANDTPALSRTLARAIEDAKCIAGVGGYAEYRLIYNDDAFTDSNGHQRKLHLGIDIFSPADANVYAPIDGKVFSVANHVQAFDYGGCLILEHETDDVVFYTLYGHLAPASLSLKAGEPVKAGQVIATLGVASENGNWPPHLHFQIILDLLGESDTFVGAGSHAYRDVWLALCPDPNLILGIPQKLLDQNDKPSEAIYASRRDHINPSLSLSYREPIHMIRGSMQYLYDATGHCYLDAVNNVPHVGHCHPRVVDATCRQARLLNTNTRYLYASLTDYCEKLLSKFPAPLEVVYLANSGSEANDLALRLARHYTSRKDIVILDHAYHGNLGSLIDISPYKHDGKGGSGRPGHVHKAIMPDRYRSPASIDEYTDSVLRSLQQDDGSAAFICESLLGCGGQIVLPDGYLKTAYSHARESGAVCIADEVQVGFGRVGSHFWGFETQGVVPDIVTLGKPIGNGHPLAAVVTTREIADTFNNGMEYFNTFGGNPVSCAIGMAVLDVIEDEGLQEKAHKTGNYLLKELRSLQSDHPIIGDVRGLGLFIGIELVNNQQSKTPAATQASFIAERMKQLGVLISTDGPYHNVLKIKPPLCFNLDNANMLVNCLHSILSESFAQP